MSNILCDSISTPVINSEQIQKDEELHHKFEKGEICKIEWLKGSRFQGSCAGCHERFDSYGIILERFNSFGEARTVYENNRSCNAELSETVFRLNTVSSPTELTQKLVETDRIKYCLAKRMNQYANATTEFRTLKSDFNVESYVNYNKDSSIISLTKDIALDPNFILSVDLDN